MDSNYFDIEDKLLNKPDKCDKDELLKFCELYIEKMSKPLRKPFIVGETHPDFQPPDDYENELEEVKKWYDEKNNISTDDSEFT